MYLLDLLAQNRIDDCIFTKDAAASRGLTNVIRLDNAFHMVEEKVLDTVVSLEENESNKRSAMPEKALSGMRAQ